MPTDISNQVGTARQFMPRADNTYQGNYRGISPVQAQASMGSDVDLAANLLKLGDALNGYMMSHEHYRDEMGHIMAERMVNSESPEDIKRLNTIDAAQQYGYADATANPYFRAYAEKIRGGFLAARMKQEYDQKYSMDPAKSLEEEARRYNEFSSDWKANNITGDRSPVNITAFDDGFNESQLANMSNLSNQWVSTKHQEDIINTYAYMNSQLGGLIANSSDILANKNEMTKRVQKILNTGRLAGLPAQYRVQLMEKWAQQFVQTGHITADRFWQMAQNVTIQTGIDGETVHLSDILDEQSYKSMAAEYNASYMSREHYDILNKFINMGEAGKTAYIDYMSKATPEEKIWLSRNQGYVFSEIARKKAEEERKRRNIAAAVAKAQKDRAGHKLTSKTDYNYLLQAQLEGKDTMNGVPIKSYRVGEDFEAWFNGQLTQLMADGNTDGYFKALALPQANDFKSQLANNYALALNSLHITGSDGGTNLDENPKLRLMLIMMQGNAQQFAATFPSLAADAFFLDKMHTIYGDDIESAAQKYAMVKGMDDDTRKSYEDEFDSKGYVDDKIAGITIQNSGGLKTKDIGLSSANNDKLIDMAKDLYVAMRYSGDSKTAWDAVKSVFVDNCTVYHNSIYPKALANNMGTPDNDTAFRYGLDALSDVVTEGTDTKSEDAQLSYDPRNAMFIGWVPGQGKVIRSVEWVREQGLWRWNEYAKQAAEAQQDAASQQQDATQEDVDDANQTHADLVNDRDTKAAYDAYKEEEDNPVQPSNGGLPGLVSWLINKATGN